jgi:hypothetical protein
MMSDYVLVVDRWETYLEGNTIREADVDRYLGRYPYVIGRADGAAVTAAEIGAARARLDPAEGTATADGFSAETQSTARNAEGAENGEVGDGEAEGSD